MNLKYFFIKMIVSVVLLVISKYISMQPEGTFESSKYFLSVTFKENVEFYKISEFIEERYGSITAFLPVEILQKGESSSVVSGKRLPIYEEVEGGLIVDTENGHVLALADGVVTFIGKDKRDRFQIEVEMGDGYSVSYSELDSVSVKIYQHIQKEDWLGVTGSSGKYLLQTKNVRGLFE